MMKAKVKTERHSVRIFAELSKWMNQGRSKCLATSQYQSVRHAAETSLGKPLLVMTSTSLF